MTTLHFAPTGYPPRVNESIVALPNPSFNELHSLFDRLMDMSTDEILDMWRREGIKAVPQDTEKCGFAELIKKLVPGVWYVSVGSAFTGVNWVDGCARMINTASMKKVMAAFDRGDLPEFDASRSAYQEAIAAALAKKSQTAVLSPEDIRDRDFPVTTLIPQADKSIPDYVPEDFIEKETVSA